MALEIIESINHGIIGLDLKGTITYINNSAKIFFPIDIKNQSISIFDLFNSISKTEFESIRLATLFNEDIEPKVMLITTEKTNKLSVILHFSPIINKEKKIKGISIVFRKLRDIEKAANNSMKLLETAPDAMVIVNKQGQIVLVNAQTENLFGYKRDELLGQEVEILIPEEFLGNHKKHTYEYTKNPKAREMGQGMDLSGKKKDGSTFPIEISLSPLKTDESVFISAAIRDITDRKKAELKFKNLLESAPDAVVIVDGEGVIQLVNEQVKNIFGFEKEELIGNKIEILIPSRFHKKHVGHRNFYLSKSQVRPMGSGIELSGNRKNGVEFPVEVSLSPLETEDGILISASIRDITERKIAEKEREALIQLKTKNKELEQFAYVASHDLQEPLRTISSFVSILISKRKDLDDESLQIMQYITESVGRMNDLVNDLLDYSLIGQKRDLTTVDTQLLIKEIILDLKRKVEETNCEIIVPSNMPTIKGAKTELRQLFQNIIFNAIKFAKAGTIPKVEIGVKELNNSWQFEVKDNGIGIRDVFQQKIFTIFKRLNSREEYQGTGIGLAQCQKVVELHGGRIWVKSAIGEGSTFYFTILK